MNNYRNDNDDLWRFAKICRVERVMPSGEKPPLPPEGHFEREGKAIANALAHLIGNNASALTPCYDEHAIEVSFGLLALVSADLKGDAREWVEQLGRRIAFAFRGLGRHFPIATDSYEHLVALQVGKAPPLRVALRVWVRADPGGRDGLLAGAGGQQRDL